MRLSNPASAQKSGAFLQRFILLFWLNMMAKPDPVPKFVEVRPKAGAIAPDVGAVAGPVELDWVDEFLSDREIRPNRGTASVAATKCNKLKSVDIYRFQALDFVK